MEIMMNYILTDRSVFFKYQPLCIAQLYEIYILIYRLFSQILRIRLCQKR